MSEPYLNDGNVPVLYVRARTIPEAWQSAMLTLWNDGIELKTSFDNPGDPPSKDATVLVEVDEPLGEPRIHKVFPASIEGLEHYRLEVTHGVHDHWVERFGTVWNYTYHERLRAYDAGDGKKIDQLENLMAIIEEKAKKGKDLTNRRFQIITWIPGVDPHIIDPPCLQRLHFRLVPHDGGYRLNMNTDWRSRDGYKAWFMNVFALTDLQRLVAGELSDRCNMPVTVGRYCDKSDSLHIYGKDFHGNGGFEGFLDRASKQTLQEMTYSTTEERETVRDIIVESRHLLAAQLDYERKTGEKARVDPNLSPADIVNFLYDVAWDK